MIAATLRWIDLNILALGRELRLSYLPPLMVYVAYGISGLTAIVGRYETFKRAFGPRRVPVSANYFTLG